MQVIACLGVFALHNVVILQFHNIDTAESSFWETNSKISHGPKVPHPLLMLIKETSILIWVCSC